MIQSLNYVIKDLKVITMNTKNIWMLKNKLDHKYNAMHLRL